VFKRSRKLHPDKSSCLFGVMKQLLVLFLLAGSAIAADIMPPASEQELSRSIFKQIVEIKSGFSTGATTPVAKAMAERFRNAGFPDNDIFLGGPIDRKWNLIVRYHGVGTRKPLLLLAHTDVVEAKREDWSMDPFQFNERDGYFYGRGTADDKSLAALWVATLLRLKREGYKPDRDIILALTADEEGGGPYNGVNWLLVNHRELIDADICLNEGGGGELLHGKRTYQSIQVAEKYVINFRLEVHNKGGHSSVPVPDNAIYRLAEALVHLSHSSFPLKTDETTKAYFEQLSKVEPPSISQTLADVAHGSLEAMQKAAAETPAWNSILRTTCVATMLEGGHALNALPQLAAANVNCRVLPEDEPAYVETTLRNAIADDQVSLEPITKPQPGPASPLRPDVMKAMMHVADSLWPGVPIVPTMSTGASDGRMLRAAGIPTYGATGLFGERGDSRAHGRDERILVKSFYEGQTFLYSLVKTLSSPTNSN
jgi:acetylornithine deacetylase/succinyl-diaminopimelate desuccinylase-like protein